MKTNNYHEAVLLAETIKAMNLKPGMIVIDCTLGGGTHSRSILESAPGIKLYAFDRDIDAINHAGELKAEFGDQLTLIHDSYANLRTRLALERVKQVDAITMDLGISSHQIDTPERGFSYMKSGDLDMRMDVREELTAARIVNSYSKEELVKIFREFGEEKESGRIAFAICQMRKFKYIKTTADLVEIIDKSTRSKMKIKARTRIFQALRIEVNQELTQLRSTLKDAVNILKPGGRIAVISFNSLEDRIVKNYFRYEEKDCVCHSSVPICQCNKEQRLKLFKSITPSAAELANVRSRSARLRYAERV